MVYVVGHRGAAGVKPENTLAGFRYAIDLGVDYVECDVHLSRDQHLVVMHDARVNRTTDGTGSIGDLDFDAIRALDAGDGEQVPTLDEVLALVQGRVKLLCELKGEGVEAATVDAVKSRGMAADVFFTSFDMERLEQVRLIGDDLLIGAILPDPGEEDIARALELGAAGIGIHYRNLCLRQVEQVLAEGLDLRAWNPDTLPEQRAMIALGAKGVSTNRPDILMDYLQTAKDNA
jgi:glycerophosphoryl diester phosphodiesterase